jgi:hypothetical protein
MRIITSIYLAIMLENFFFWLNNGSHPELFPTAYSYLTWSLYGLSLLALLAYILGKRLLPARAWQLVLFVYLATRLYELMTSDLVLSGDNLNADLNTLSSYLWLVIPPGLAMWYLGFVFFCKRKSLGNRDTKGLMT